MKINNNKFNLMDIIEELKEKNNLQIELIKKGKNYICSCPFHSEKTGSLSISPEKNIFKCFGCGASGGPIEFYEKFTGKPKNIVEKELAIKYGLIKNDIPKLPDEQIFIQKANKFFKIALNNTKRGIEEGLEYLKQRNVSSKTIEEFEIGYALNGEELKNSLIDIANEYKLNLNALENIGLFDTKGNSYFKNRIIFPIKNIEGAVIGFVGRTTKNDSVKYLNSPESSIYKKGENVFNLYNAMPYISKSGNQVFICEGAFDCLKISSSGCKNVVATLGTSFTNKQVKLIKTVAQTVISSFDGDKSGINATFRMYKICKLEGLDFKVIAYPNKMDPDEYSQKNNLNKYLNNKENLLNIFDYFLMITPLTKNIQKLIDYKNNYFKLLSFEKEKILINNSLKKFALKFNINENSLIEEYYNSLSYLSFDELLAKRNEIIDVLKKCFLNKENIKFLPLINKNLLTKEEKKFFNSLFIYFKNNNFLNENIFLRTFPELENQLKAIVQKKQKNIFYCLENFNKISIELFKKKNKIS